MREKITRYRATWEFELKYPSDYKYVREAFERFVKGLQENYRSINSDYLAIEKVDLQKSTGG